MQSGGLKLIHPKKTGFLPVKEMIAHPSSTLKLLTFNSLKGFMVVLNVLPDVSVYKNQYAGRFTEPVTSFILKFALMHTNEYEQLQPPYKGTTKTPETFSSFFEEAKLQNAVWMRSIAGGHTELCPSIGNLSMFERQGSIDLLEFLLEKTRGDPKLQDMFSYLSVMIQNANEYSMGVILMRNLDTSQTLYKYNHTHPKTDEAKVSVLANVVRLFLLGVIHFDLHENNALVFAGRDGEICSEIIDFGRASDLNTGADDKYLTVKQKQSILKKMEDLAFMFREGSLEPTQAQLNQLNSVFSGIFHVEHRENRRVFGSFFTDERFQMNWAEDSLYTVEEGKKYFFIDVVAEVYRLVYNEMHKHSGDFRLQGSTIDGYMRSGEFPNFLEGRTPEDFIVDFPTTTNCRGPQCVVSGGFRRKTSRTKRRTHKKNQSRRKQNFKKF